MALLITAILVGNSWSTKPTMQSYFFQLIKILYSVIIHFAWIGKKNLINVPTKMIHILFGQLECLKENKYNVSCRSIKTHYIYGFKARSHITKLINKGWQELQMISWNICVNHGVSCSIGEFQKRQVSRFIKHEKRIIS